MDILNFTVTIAECASPMLRWPSLYWKKLDLAFGLLTRVDVMMVLSTGIALLVGWNLPRS
jgi:hypothetical protein